MSDGSSDPQTAERKAIDEGTQGLHSEVAGEPHGREARCHRGARHDGGGDPPDRLRIRTDYFEPEYSDAFKRYSYLEIVKVEIVCAERDVERLTAAIREENTNGSPGDGWIFVSDVVAALRIRDGKEGEEALAAARR